MQKCNATARPIPVARIDFLCNKGVIRESVEYSSAEEFLKELKEELHYGVPLGVTLYSDARGNHISRRFLSELDTLPKWLTVEPAPQSGKKPAERSDAR